MTRYDQKILFTALAFMAVVTKEGNKLEVGGAQNIMKLAGWLEAFCLDQISPSIGRLELVDDEGAAQLDLSIERHVKELRQKEATQLPQDKETLLKFYDRLQVRKFRRTQSSYYLAATAEYLSDLVLGYLEEEIEELGSML